MTQYVASAIKYRPQKFSEVIGQAATVKVLQNAIRLNRIANVYLFSGPRGTGKTTTARLLAKALNCDDMPRQLTSMELPDPCDQCRSCVGIRNSKDSEVLELDAASHNGVDDMRELMQIASQQPKQGKWRILLLDEAHMLTKEAQNSLLKLAEEPPKNFLLILCTTEPEKILPTIRSRCSKFAIKPLPPKDVIGSLRRIFAASAQPITEDALTALSLVGHGSLRDVQQVADQLISNACGMLVDDDILETQAGIPSVKMYKRLAAGLSQAWDEGPRIWFELCEELYNEGHDFEQIFFEMLVNIIRDCRVALVSKNDDAPCVPYWTGIPHQLFQQHLCFTSRDLDIMNEAWNEKEGHFNVVFGRAVVELWLLQAWDVMQFELPERIVFASKFPGLDKKALDQKWHAHKQLEKKLLCRCSSRSRYGFDVPCANSSGCEAVGACCGRVVFFFGIITAPIAENVRPWRGSCIHHRSTRVE